MHINGFVSYCLNIFNIPLKTYLLTLPLRIQERILLNKRYRNSKGHLIISTIRL